MDFAPALTPGRLIKRYKRFLCDIELDDGTTLTAACPNTGSMRGLAEPGMRVWLSQSDNPKRKYKHTWELVETDEFGITTTVGINPNNPNRLASEAIEAGLISELTGYGSLRREVKYGKSSRIDILLESDDKPSCYVEIKNVHYCRNQSLAEFPDSKTERGTKHLNELADMVAQGHRAVMLYVIQRDDVDRLTFAADIDPQYAKTFSSAQAAGVEMLAYCWSVSPKAITLKSALPVFAASL